MRSAGLFVVGAVFSLAPAAEAQQYRIVELTPNASVSVARGINNDGVVCGYYDSGTSTGEGFLWDQGVITLLGTSWNAGYTWAYAYNGTVAVGVGQELPDQTADPALWSGSPLAVQDLGTFGGPFGAAYDINASDQAVGYAQNRVDVGGGVTALFARPFVYENGVKTELDTLGAYAGEARGINDAGVIVGFSSHNAVRRPLQWQLVSGSYQATDMGTPTGYTQGELFDINDLGDAVGSVGAGIPALWTSGSSNTLPILTGLSRGWVFALDGATEKLVGYCGNTSGTTRTATIWTQSGGGSWTATDLLSLVIPGHSWTELTEAYDINDRGEIVGDGELGGVTQAYMVLCIGDFNRDGSLTAADFTAFAASYTANDMFADINSDGALTVADYTAFQAGYLAGCP